VPALDAGAMVSKGVLPINERSTAQSLHDGLAAIGGELMVEAMDRLSETGVLEAEPQDAALVTYAEKLQKSEAMIDWTGSATAISRQVRAFNPFPVAQSPLHGEVCRIWMATSQAGKGKPGEVVAIGDTILIGTGDGLLSVEELQLPGGKRLPVKDFMAGRRLKIGDRFGD
jgi:methionyl-tRNA formyltransferase